MKKQDWFIVTGVLLGLCLLEQVVQWAMSPDMVQRPALSGQFHLGMEIYKNIIFSSFFGLFFLCLFLLLNFILKEKLIGFRLALAVFTAGMLGESLGFLIQGSMGHIFQVGGLRVGLSHFYIFIGVLSTVFFSVKDFSLIFNKDSVRKKLLIEKDQYAFCFYVILPYFLFIGGFYMFFHVFIQMVLSFAPRMPINTRNDIINTFFSLFSTLSLCFLLTLTLFIVYLSNKVYGPVYAFKKYIRDVFLKGEADRTLKFRSADHFQELVGLAKELKKVFPLKNRPSAKVQGENKQEADKPQSATLKETAKKE